MTNEELNTELYKKLFAEQEKFKGAPCLGVPLETSGGPSSRCRRAALSRGMSCFFAFCCDGAPQLSQGDWEVCWCDTLLP